MKSVAVTERAVIVTTSHRGIFFGYAADTSGNSIKLKRGRNCISWSSDLRGFVGLATVGPNKSCKVGPAADMEVRDITAVLEVSKEAAEKWENAPWMF